MKKIVLITGASRGIGRSVTEYLKDDYIVIANYNKSKDKALELKDMGVDIYKADVTNRLEVKNMIDYVINKYGKIDVLVNNAGIDQEKLFLDIEDDDFNHIINGNLYSTFIVTKEVLKHMLREKSGSVINISYIDGINGASNASMYSATKGAINSLTKSLAKEFGPSNIRVNAIAPGCIDTDMNKYLTKEEWDYLINKTSLGRKGTGLDIAKGVKFLIEEEFITGQIITIDGGFED